MGKESKVPQRVLLTVTIIVCVVLALSAVAVLGEKRLDYLFASRYEEQLNTLTGFEASVGSATVETTKRRFTFEDIVIRKQGVGDQPPYFRVDTMEVQLNGPWYDSDSTIDVTLTGPKAYLIRGGKHPQLKPDPQWREKVSAQLPYDADSLTIRRGKVVYVDHERGSRWEAQLSGSAKHLLDGANPDASQPMVVGLIAMLEEGGRLQVRLETNTGVNPPTFWLRVAAEEIPLVRLERQLRERFDLKVKEGRLTVVLQASGESGKFKGRFRPTLENVDLQSEGGRDTMKSTIGEWVAHKIDQPFGDQSAWIAFHGTYGSKGLTVESGEDLSLLQGQLMEGVSERLED